MRGCGISVSLWCVCVQVCVCVCVSECVRACASSSAVTVASCLEVRTMRTGLAGDQICYGRAGWGGVHFAGNLDCIIRCR